MIANWKLLGLASIGLAAIAGAAPYGDTDASLGAGASSRIVAEARGCISHYSTRCTVEIRYAYPAADLSVAPEDIYF